VLFLTSTRGYHFKLSPVNALTMFLCVSQHTIVTRIVICVVVVTIHTNTYYFFIRESNLWYWRPQVEVVKT